MDPLDFGRIDLLFDFFYHLLHVLILSGELFDQFFFAPLGIVVDDVGILIHLLSLLDGPVTVNARTPDSRHSADFTQSFLDALVDHHNLLALEIWCIEIEAQGIF